MTILYHIHDYSACNCLVSLDPRLNNKKKWKILYTMSGLRHTDEVIMCNNFRFFKYFLF